MSTEAYITAVVSIVTAAVAYLSLFVSVKLSRMKDAILAAVENKYADKGVTDLRFQQTTERVEAVERQIDAITKTQKRGR